MRQLDEIHQLFVPGEKEKYLMMIDSCGAFCGIMVSMLTQKLIEKRKVSRAIKSAGLSF